MARGGDCMTRKSASLPSRVHWAFVDPLRRTGRAATRAEVADRLHVGLDAVDGALAELTATHGAVLHPHTGEPWVLHPFSTSPTAVWVDRGDIGWWAPCAWCAFGVAHLAGGDVAIHLRLGGESETITIHVVDGEVVEEDLWVHFSVPPRDAWDNVHHFCATVLPFRDRDEVAAWSARHGLAHGEAVPVRQANALGREWYARHADENWRKWTGSEAAEIFARVGLVGPFWALPVGDEAF